MRHFYVYEHWRPDLDVCFYVGKGHGRRSSDMRRSRHRHHIGIQKKLAALGMCVEIRMVASDLAEDEALKIECERIAFWIGAGVKLANKTAGGDGLRNPSIETRAKIAEGARRLHTGRKRSDETKANISASLSIAMKDPATRAKIRVAAKAQWSDPERRNKILSAIRISSASEENAAARSASQMGNKKSLGKKRSAETIAKQIASFKSNRIKNPITDDMRARMSAGQKRRFAKAKAEGSKHLCLK